MGPGHFATALAAKSIAPKAPLWALLVASETLDLLFFGFSALGLEDPGISTTSLETGVKVVTPGVMPWSHGLFMALAWALLAAAIAGLVYRDHRTASVIGLVVFGHWLLDFIVHPGELPLLFSGSPTVGLGLWTSGPGLIASGFLEVILWIVGGILYMKVRRGKA